jgi:hypothetical protein
MIAIGDGPVPGALETRSCTTKYVEKPVFFVVVVYLRVCDTYATPRIFQDLARNLRFLQYKCHHGYMFPYFLTVEYARRVA